jgi:hypothetical protein
MLFLFLAYFSKIKVSLSNHQSAFVSELRFKSRLEILCKNIAALFDSLYELKITENGRNDLSVTVRVLE